MHRLVACAGLTALLCLWLGSPSAGVAEPTAHPVEGFLADALAGRPAATTSAWWDGETVGGRVFPKEWPTLSAPVRAEIGGVAIRYLTAVLLQSLAMPGRAGRNWSGVPEVGKAEPLPDSDGLPAMAVAIKGTLDGKPLAVRLRFLLARSSPPRLADWAFESQSWVAADAGRALAHLQGRTRPPDLLTFAWQELQPGEQPPSDSLLYALPAPPAPEWATRDLYALTLPAVANAPADVALDVSPASRWGPRVVLHLTADGTVHYRPDGRRSRLRSLDLNGAFADPKQRANGIGLLLTALADAAGQPGMRRSDGWSALRLLLRADRTAPWRAVYELALLAGHPTVLASEVGFVLQGQAADRPALISVPTLALLESTPAPKPEAQPSPGGTPLVVKLFRKNLEQGREKHYTRMRIGEGLTLELPQLGSGPTADSAAARAAVFTKVREALSAHRSASGVASPPCAVRMPFPIGPSVPLEDVLEMLQTVRDAGLLVVELG